RLLDFILKQHEGGGVGPNVREQVRDVVEEKERPNIDRGRKINIPAPDIHDVVADEHQIIQYRKDMKNKPQDPISADIPDLEMPQWKLEQSYKAGVNDKEFEIEDQRSRSLVGRISGPSGALSLDPKTEDAYVQDVLNG